MLCLVVCACAVLDILKGNADQLFQLKQEVVAEKQVRPQVSTAAGMRVAQMPGNVQLKLW